MAYLLDERSLPILDELGNPIGSSPVAYIAEAVPLEGLLTGHEAGYLLDAVHVLTEGLRHSLTSVPAQDLLHLSKSFVKGTWIPLVVIQEDTRLPQEYPLEDMEAYLLDEFGEVITDSDGNPIGTFAEPTPAINTFAGSDVPFAGEDWLFSS